MCHKIWSKIRFHVSKRDPSITFRHTVSLIGKSFNYYNEDDDDDGKKKLSFVESELIVSEILLATAPKCTTKDEDRDDSAEKTRVENYW